MSNEQKPYLSWSRFRKYEDDPQKYFTEYILGLKPPPTRKMIFGSMFSKAYEDRTLDFAAELKREGFTADYVRVMSTALVMLPDIGKENCEVTFRSAYSEMDLLGIFDGYLKQDLCIIENKTGKLWTQERADTDDQLTFYALLHLLKTNWLPGRITLNSVKEGTGAVHSFETARNNNQIGELRKRIDCVIYGITNEIWTK